MFLWVETPVSAPSAAQDWLAVSKTYEAAIRNYAASLGQDPNSPSLDTTIRTNTTLVPQRTGDLLEILRALAGVESLDGLRVLDLGCGWGSMATYIAQQYRPARVVGVDNREDFLKAATECTRWSGVKGVEYFKADMTTLAGVEAGSFDLLIANNALPYLIAEERLDQAAAAAFRVAAPGATLIAHQANRWQLRDPFTDEPLVHMLGPGAVRKLGRITGWHGSHDRLRLFGPSELEKRLHAAGFSDSRVASFGAGHKLERGLRARRGRYFAVTARKP